MKKKSYEIEYMSINPKPKHQEFLVKPFPAPLSDKLEQPKRFKLDSLDWLFIGFSLGFGVAQIIWWFIINNVNYLI